MKRVVTVVAIIILGGTLLLWAPWQLEINGNQSPVVLKDENEMSDDMQDTDSSILRDGWLTYISDKAMITFMYPSELTVVPLGNTPEDRERVALMRDGEQILSFVLLYEARYDSAEEGLEALRQSDSFLLKNGTIMDERTIASIDGSQGILYFIEVGEGAGWSADFVIDGMGVGFAQGSSTEFEKDIFLLIAQSVAAI